MSATDPCRAAVLPLPFAVSSVLSFALPSGGDPDRAAVLPLPFLVPLVVRLAVWRGQPTAGLPQAGRTEIGPRMPLSLAPHSF